VQKVVWISDWEMQCCGGDFRVGSEVDWTLSPTVYLDWKEAALGPTVAASVTDDYDEHGIRDNGVLTHGTVQSIRAAFCEYAPRPRRPSGTELYPVTNTGSCEDRTSSNSGFEPASPTLKFIGYLVDLTVEDPISLLAGGGPVRLMPVAYRTTAHVITTAQSVWSRATPDSALPLRGVGATAALRDRTGVGIRSAAIGNDRGDGQL
jgi:hypothetical protein